LQPQPRLGQQNIHIRLPIGFDGPHVSPIPFKGIGVDLFHSDGIPDDVLAEIVSAAFLERFLKIINIENIHAHGGEIALGFIRFLLPIDDALLLVDYADAKMAGFFPGHAHHGDGNLGFFLLVKLDHGGIIHPVDMIPGKDKQAFRMVAAYELHILGYSICRATVPIVIVHTCGRGQNLGAAAAPKQIPRLPGANMTHERIGAVLGENANLLNPGIHGIAEGEIDEPVTPAKRYCRFGTHPAEDVEAASHSAREQERDGISHLIVLPLAIDRLEKSASFLLG